MLVWNPGDNLWLSPRFQALKRTIEQQYRKETHFGLIEVWRHLPGETTTRNADSGRRDPSTTSISRTPASRGAQRACAFMKRRPSRQSSIASGKRLRQTRVAAASAGSAEPKASIVR